MTDRLGVDFGGVIVEPRARGGGGDTRFHDDFLETQAVAGVAEGLAELVACFAGEVWIVSKAGPTTARLTLEWLRATRLLARVRLREDRVRFCRSRAEKAPICHELGITHFIDDQPEVLGYLGGIVRYRYLFGQGAGEPVEPRIEVVRSWDHAGAVIRASIESRTDPAA